MTYINNITQAIGNTPLLKLNKIGGIPISPTFLSSWKT